MSIYMEKQHCPFPKIHPSQLNRDDAFYMALAYNQAIEAWREDEVPVGAVIELGGEVIASAHNQVIQTCDATAHAEVLAITPSIPRHGRLALGWRDALCD